MPGRPTGQLLALQQNNIVPANLGQVIGNRAANNATTDDYDFMLRDSRAQGLLVSKALWPVFEPLLPNLMGLKQIIVDGGDDSTPGVSFANLLRQSSPLQEPSHTLADDVCFWLYSSGSTGSPKGTLHLHSHVVQTAELYGRAVLGLQENDVVFSAAKLFFAYGLGNALSFPLTVGATTVLLPGASAAGVV